MPRPSRFGVRFTHAPRRRAPALGLVSGPERDRQRHGSCRDAGNHDRHVPAYRDGGGGGCHRGGVAIGWRVRPCRRPGIAPDGRRSVHFRSASPRWLRRGLLPPRRVPLSMHAGGARRLAGCSSRSRVSRAHGHRVRLPGGPCGPPSSHRDSTSHRLSELGAIGAARRACALGDAGQPCTQGSHLTMWSTHVIEIFRRAARHRHAVAS